MITPGDADLGPPADRGGNRTVLHRVVAGEVFWSAPRHRWTYRGGRGFHAAEGMPLPGWPSVLLERALARGWVALGRADRPGQPRPLVLTRTGHVVLAVLEQLTGSSSR